MQRNIEARPERTPIVKRAAAGLVLIAVAALAVKIVIGFVISIFFVIVAIAAVAAVIWALKTI